MSRYSPRERLTNTTSTSVVANWFGNQFVALPSSFESISTVTVGSGGQATIDFTSIPGTYTHLQVRALTKTASSGDGIRLRFNSDSGSNYSYHLLYGTGASAAVAAGTSQTIMPCGNSTYSGTNASTFGANVIDILDYANTNKYKTVRSLAGYDLNGSGELRYSSGLWMSTSAVTSITFYNASGAGDYQQYAHFALYGIKGV
jgi:hypothetical protein